MFNNQLKRQAQWHPHRTRTALGGAWCFKNRCRSARSGQCAVRRLTRQNPAIQCAAADFRDQPKSQTSPPSGLMQSFRKHLHSPHDAELLQLALPALLSMLLDPLMNAVDAAIVGNLGTQQLGAVSLGGMAISFSTFMFSFLLFLTTPKIAAAAVKEDWGKVSRTASASIWLAGVIGVAMGTAVCLGASNIVQTLKPPEPAVAAFAFDFIRVRALAIPAIMLSYVASGTYRGLRDTRTPLFASVGAAITNLLLNVVFIFGLGWGVFGSGLATTIAQYVSLVVLYGLLLSKGVLRVPDLMVPPPLKEVLPLLRAGAALSVRVIVSFGMVLYASALCVRTGSTVQAGFEVVRQVWVMSIQFFECLNIATQALCAAYLGADNRPQALSVLLRGLVLGLSVASVLGLAIWLAQANVAAIFTRDSAVVAQVMATLPLVCVFFPLDAAASILDGGLMAAQQTDILSAMQISGSLVQYGMLAWITSTGLISTFTIWAVLKFLTLVRCGGGLYINFYSKQSAYVGPRLLPAAGEGAEVAKEGG